MSGPHGLGGGAANQTGTSTGGGTTSLKNEVVCAVGLDITPHTHSMNGINSNLDVLWLRRWWAHQGAVQAILPLQVTEQCFYHLVALLQFDCLLSPTFKEYVCMTGRNSIRENQ
jgi:hypothetical protein